MKLMNVGQAPVAPKATNQVSKAATAPKAAVAPKAAAPAHAGKALNVKG